MKKLLSSILALASISLSAQELPQPSPSAHLEQRVGLTDFTVDYSRPAMRGRVIFGDLVPYNTLWRTGANKATAIEFDTEVMFDNESIAPGKYSIFTIPGEGEWEFILHSNTELWGTDGYDEANDVYRGSFPVMDMPMQESFTLNFDAIDGGSAQLQISWAGKGIQIPIKVDVQKKALANIKEALANSKEEDLWRVNRNAATYFLRNDLGAEKALAYIQTSVELNPDSWYSHYVHGEVLAATGKTDEAVKAANRALEMGQAAAKEAGNEFGYAGMIEEAINKWNSK